MGLKFKYQRREEIPAEQAGFYCEHDGAWVLDAEGVVEKSKLEELRSQQAALARERDELRQRYDGIDPAEVRQLAEEKRKLEEARQLQAGELDRVVENRIKGMKADWERQVTGLTAERDALTGRLTAIQIDQGVVTVATKRGLRPTAMPDITARARQVFRLVNGVPTAFEGDGKTVRYGRDGITPMTMEEWADLQVAEAPHLFEANAGGGAASAGGAAHGGRVMRNPFRKETWNLTEQMKVQKTDPGLAARLRASA